MSNVCIYDRVTLQNGIEGEVQFMGMIEDKEGIFYGIKLDEAKGKNNGTVNNIKYFQCDDKYGIFVRENKIKIPESRKLNQVLPRVSIGDRVYVKHKRQHGILRFVGIVEFEKGCWYGLELQEPLGKNNGSVHHRQYFQCMQYYGIFCQIKNIQTTKQPVLNNKIGFDANNDSDFDPELHDIPPEKDDFFEPIASPNDNDNDNDDIHHHGSVIYINRNKTGSMVALQAASDDDQGQQNGNIMKEHPLDPPKANNKNDSYLNKPPFTVSKSTTELDNHHNRKKPERDNNNNYDTNNAATNWIMLPDPKTGKFYYANLKTKETRWKPPLGIDIIQTNTSNQWQNREYLHHPHVSQTVSSGNLEHYQQQPPQYQNNPQFTAYHPNGKMTKSQSSMDMTSAANNKNTDNNKNKSVPQKHKPLRNKNVKKRKGGGGSYSIDVLTKLEAAKWRKTKDPSTGRKYWYHKETKQTTWDTPPAVLKVSAQNAVGSIYSMEEILKPEWDENESDSDYSTSGSYDTDDNTESETEHDDEKQPPRNEQYGEYQQQQIQQQWNNQQQQQQWNNNNYTQWQQQQYYPPQQAPMKKQESARSMYLKPAAATNQGISGNDNGYNDNGYNDNKLADNPWITEEEAKSRIIVRDTLKRYWQIGAEQGYKLEEWAKSNYQMGSHKKGLFGKKQQSLTDILSYIEFGKLKNPLNAASTYNDKLNGQCMQTWKNINSYMGIRKSGKSSQDHIEKLIRFALRGDDTLRNEIYCQITKQTTKNPKFECLLKGWKLLLICCSFFPPSDKFGDYLACFLWNNSHQSNEIGQYAIKALHALDATMLSGARKYPPLPLEIVKLENLQPIPLNIYFINGMKCKQVLVSSQTRAKQVIQTLAQTFNFKHPQIFGLYEMETNIPSLDKMKKHYIKRELMSQKEKINDLIHMPFERELEDDDRMLDVIASWLKRGNKVNSNKKCDKLYKNIRFVLKVKTFRKSKERKLSNVGAKINFLTHVWHIINDFYPLSVDDEDFALHLAALQLQGTYGPKMNKTFYKKGSIAYDLHKYLGHAMLKKYLPGNRNECEAKILQFRASKYSNMSRSDCWLRYAKMLRNNKKLHGYVGAAWYRGVRIEDNNEGNRNINDLLIGINEYGIHFVNPITQNIVERYEMEEILTFGYRSNAFLFVSGTLMIQHKIQIATMHGKAINGLVRSHIDLRVRDAQKKRTKINQYNNEQ